MVSLRRVRARRCLEGAPVQGLRAVGGARSWAHRRPDLYPITVGFHPFRAGSAAYARAASFPPVPDAVAALDLERLQPFACPVCGRIRPLTPTAARSVARGDRLGECIHGTGCRTALDKHERLARFWLIEAAGVDERDVRRAGSAADYVLEHGLPDVLRSLADVLPTGDLIDRRGGAGRPTRGPSVPVG